MSYGPGAVRRLYDATFPAGGTLAASAYGYLTRRRKLGSRFHHTLAALLRAERWSSDELLAESRRRLVAFAEMARSRTPHYRDAFARLLGADRPVRHIEEALALPLLSKADIRSRPEAFRPVPARRGRERTVHTSGTTGSALTVHLSDAAYQDEYAFTWLHRGKVGARPGCRIATFAGHPVVPAARRRPPFWVTNHADNQMLFSSYHLEPAALPHYVRRLESWQPEILHGYPSALAEMARAVLEHGRRPIRPLGIFPASETILSGQRDLLRRAFGCPVLGWYGNTELAAHATECLQGRIHVQHLHSFMEILDPDGRPCAPGQEGEIVGSSLLNGAMPLIRYRTGDAAVPAAGDCGCGLGGWVLQRIVGRMDDVVVTPEGRRVGRLDHLFKETEAIREGQIEQTSIDSVTLRVAAAPGSRPQWEPVLLAEARRRLGPGMTLVIEEVPCVPRGPNGKFRSVISSFSKLGPGSDR